MQEPEYIFTKGIGWHVKPLVPFVIVTHKNGKRFRIESRAPEVGETYVNGDRYNFNSPEKILVHMNGFDWHTGINRASEHTVQVLSGKAYVFTVLDA